MADDVRPLAADSRYLPVRCPRAGESVWVSTWMLRGDGARQEREPYPLPACVAVSSACAVQRTQRSTVCPGCQLPCRPHSRLT